MSGGGLVEHRPEEDPAVEVGLRSAALAAGEPALADLVVGDEARHRRRRAKERLAKQAEERVRLGLLLKLAVHVLVRAARRTDQAEAVERVAQAPRARSDDAIDLSLDRLDRQFDASGERFETELLLR